MASEYLKWEGKSRYLAKLCNKSYGTKNHKQRIESDREKDNDRDIRIATRGQSASQFLRDTETQ